MYIEILKSKPHNKHFLDKYIKLIKSFSYNNGNNTKKEAHHILPKAKDMFPEYKSFKENPWNKILLTPRQHIICHICLAKAYPSSSQTYARFRMTKIRDNYGDISSMVKKWYANNQHPKGMLGKKHSEKTKELFKDRPNGMLGKKHSDYSKQKISEKNKKFVICREILSGKNIRIPHEIFHLNRHLYQTLGGWGKEINRGVVSAFDIIDLIYVKISKAEFEKNKNTRYVGVASKKAKILKG